MDVIDGVGDLYRSLAIDPKELGARLWTEGLVRAPEDITLGAMVLTAAANCLISGKWEAEPLSHAAWPEVFRLLKPPEIDRVVMDWVHRTVFDRERRSLGEAYLVPILRDYDLEMRPFSGQNPPEAYLVKFFMFGR